MTLAKRKIISKVFTDAVVTALLLVLRLYSSQMAIILVACYFHYPIGKILFIYII